MTVYVVLEEYGGSGATVVGVYRSETEAYDVAGLSGYRTVVERTLE